MYRELQPWRSFFRFGSIRGNAQKINGKGSACDKGEPLVFSYSRGFNRVSREDWLWAPHDLSR